MTNFSQYEPPPRRRKKSGGLLVPLLCVVLGVVAIWSVLRLSTPNGVGASLETQFAQIELPESLQFLQGRGDVVIVSLILAVALWMMFRRPRSR